MTTALRRQDHDGLLDSSPADRRTELGVFTDSESLRELFIAAEAVRALGYEPTVVLDLDNAPRSVRLIAGDVPSLAGQLRASLVVSKKQPKPPTDWTDERWKNVTADTLVDFEGAACKYGELSQNEKTLVTMDANGQLHGGYDI